MAVATGLGPEPQTLFVGSGAVASPSCSCQLCSKAYYAYSICCPGPVTADLLSAGVYECHPRWVQLQGMLPRSGYQW